MSDSDVIRGEPNHTGHFGPLEPEPHSDNGFTLIELMIVIVVLSIVSGAAIFAMGGIRGDSVKSACQSHWKSLKLSAEAVNTRMGTYPDASDVWDGGTGTPLTTNNALVVGNTRGPGGTENGALVRSYPAEEDFALEYLKPNPTGAPNSFAIRVLRASNGSATGPISGTYAYSYTDTDCASL